MKVGAWIRANRLKLGITQAQLGARIGLGQTTISKWERHLSEPSLAELDRLGYIFSDTFHNEKEIPGRENAQYVPVMGHLGVAQRVVLSAETELEYIKPPPGAPKEARCVLVNGNNFPPFKHGTALLFWAWTSNPAVYLGELCLVKLADGAVYVRTIELGAKAGLWTLAGPPGEAPICDIEIAECALIEQTFRRPQWITKP